MKVFISYSVDDKEFVGRIAQAITPYAQVRYWDKDREPGKEAWPEIFSWIDECDTVLTVITDKVVKRAMSVGQEIGHAKAKRKRIIPLVEEGVSTSALGCLSGVTYEPIPKDAPFKVLDKLFALFNQPATAVASTKKSSAGDVLVILGLIYFVIKLFSDKNS